MSAINIYKWPHLSTSFCSKLNFSSTVKLSSFIKLVSASTSSALICASTLPRTTFDDSLAICSMDSSILDDKAFADAMYARIPSPAQIASNNTPKNKTSFVLILLNLIINSPININVFAFFIPNIYIKLLLN